MSKIVYAGLPAHGHTNPILPVVHELIERGHEVLFYNVDAFRDKVAPTGVDFRPYPEPVPGEREIVDAMQNGFGAPLVISKMSHHLALFMIEELEREQPDLVIYDSVAMWGYIAARVVGIPQIASITHFVLDGSKDYIGLGTIVRLMWSMLPEIPRLLRWRKAMANEFGSENSGGITEYAERNIVFTSDDFHPVNNMIDDRFRFVGPSLNPATRDGEFPFEQLGQGRMVYISLGTINHLNRDFYREAFAAFADYPAQFVLSVGKQTHIADLGDIPANFIVRYYVPQLEILQRTDAFITHGGMNSVHEGLVYEVPLIVVPNHFEQLLNGKRVEETGSGLLLGEKYPYGKVTAQELREALDSVLGDPSYKQQAALYGRSLLAAGGYQQAVAEIEDYLGVEEPVLAYA